MTIDELTAELAAHRGISVHRSSIGGLLHRLGLSHKKNALQAAEQKRRDVARARQIWSARRQPFMRDALERLAFIDDDVSKDEHGQGNRVGAGRGAIG